MLLWTANIWPIDPPANRNPAVTVRGLHGTAVAFEQMGFAPGRPGALVAGLGEADVAY